MLHPEHTLDQIAELLYPGEQNLFHIRAVFLRRVVVAVLCDQHQIDDLDVDAKLFSFDGRKIVSSGPYLRLQESNHGIGTHCDFVKIVC